MDSETPRAHVQRPHLGDAGAGVEAILHATVEGRRAVPDLEDEQDVLGLRDLAKVTAWTCGRGAYGVTSRTRRSANGSATMERTNRTSNIVGHNLPVMRKVSVSGR